MPPLLPKEIGRFVSDMRKEVQRRHAAEEDAGAKYEARQEEAHALLKTEYASTTQAAPMTAEPGVWRLVRATLRNRLDVESIGVLTLDVIEACRLPAKASLYAAPRYYVEVALSGRSRKGVEWPVGRRFRARTKTVDKDRSPWSATPAFPLAAASPRRRRRAVAAVGSTSGTRASSGGRAAR